MALMTFQRIDQKKKNIGDSFDVQFNPPEYEFSKNASYSEVVIPGLDSPILQFVNGQSEKLTLELFFDSTEKGGTGEKAEPVNEFVDKFYRLVKVDGKMHAPPIVRVSWGEDFPGQTTNDKDKPVSAFDAVVESLSRKYTLFNSKGVPLRATVSVTLREYKTLEDQLLELKLQSSDHTRARVVSQGDNLPYIAYEAYQDSARWRDIADFNNLFDVRTLKAGTILLLPPIN